MMRRHSQKDIKTLKTLRIVLVLAAVVVAGIGIAVALTSSYTGQSDAIGAARTIGKINEDSADSAPKQQVVNGWLAADFLEIQTQQLNDIGKAQSTTNLMLGLIGAVAALGFVAIALKSKPDEVVTAEPAATSPVGGAVSGGVTLGHDISPSPAGESPSSRLPPPA